MDISEAYDVTGTEVKRIRVLHVAEPGGGVDRYLKTLFKYTDRKKVENIFICSQNYYPGDYSNLCDAVEQVDMAHEISAYDDLKSASHIRKLIVKYRPDIVYAHSSKSGGLLRMADMGISNKVIYNPHGWSFEMDVSDKKKAAYRRIERIQAPFTDRIVCISMSEKIAAIRNRICPSEKLVQIDNGIDLAAVKAADKIDRECLQIPDGAPVIGMVGRIADQKAPDVFVRAASMIKEQIPDAFFVIVGDGPLKYQIQALIEKYGLTDSFRITGWVTDPCRYMKVFDVGMLLSRWEGFGLAVPEMMYCEVPVIASAVGGLRDIITDGKDGLMVPPGDTHRAAEAAVKLLNDGRLRDRLRINGRRTVSRRYDAKRMAEETEEMYEEVLG